MWEHLNSFFLGEIEQHVFTVVLSLLNHFEHHVTEKRSLYKLLKLNSL